MKKILLSLLIIAVSGLASAGTVLYVPEKFSFQKDVRFNEKIKAECGLEQTLANDVADSAHGTYDKVVREKPSGSYDVLDIEITEVFGPGGGAWSGPKNMNIRGTLKSSSGKSLGSFTASRFSTGGAFGGFKGTCGILRRISKALGKDVAKFLAAPEEGVQMGN